MLPFTIIQIQDKTSHMKPAALMKYWAEYSPAKVNMTIHPDDVMYNSAQKPEHYAYCGESGIEVISAALLAGPTTHVGHVLDFSCGYGRVGRYIRALFPIAQITFSEVEAEAADFCASQFYGKALVTPKDVNAVELPEKYDVIWLGSVFTHMDYDRIKILFGKLFNALTPNGVIIGTFRGEKMYRSYQVSPEAAARDADLIREFEKSGAAYRRYPGWSDDWGLSLVHPAKLIEMGKEHPDARLIMYSEVGWASAHDAVAWTNTSPRTIIR